MLLFPQSRRGFLKATGAGVPYVTAGDGFYADGSFIQPRTS
jgi:hypothetical protein